MRIAFSNIAWPVDAQDTVARSLVEAGVSGVEIAPTMIWPDPTTVSRAEADAVRTWWAERGIEVVAMQALLYGRPELTIFEHEQARRNTLDYLRGIFRLAGWLGARRLVFGSPRNRKAGDLDPQERDRIAVAFFSEAGRLANACDVMLCIEANPTDYGCDYINTVAEARQLVTAVDSPGFGLHLDTGGMTLTGESADAIRGIVPDHFHISEPFLGMVGRGDADHRAFAFALRDSGYDGWCSVEMRRPETDLPLNDLREVMRFAAELYGG